MTKDEFQKSAAEQNNVAPTAKKDTAGAASVQVKVFLPPAPSPPGAKPPFGMPLMAVAKNVKIIPPAVVPQKDDEQKDPELED